MSQKSCAEIKEGNEFFFHWTKWSVTNRLLENVVSFSEWAAILKTSDEKNCRLGYLWMKRFRFWKEKTVKFDHSKFFHELFSSDEEDVKLSEK